MTPPVCPSYAGDRCPAEIISHAVWLSGLRSPVQTGDIGRLDDDGYLWLWINSRVGAVQRVAAVRILPELPSGAMGKILKRELRDRFSGVFGVFAQDPAHAAATRGDDYFRAT